MQGTGLVAGGAARRVGLALLCAAALGACGGQDAGEVAPGPNVFVIVLDAASAAYISPYGAPDDATPHISQLAADSVVFENAYSQTASTVSSMVSLWTGVRLTTHRTGPSRTIPKQYETLPELLQQHGYRTIGMVGNPNAGAPAIGYDRGYDVYVEVYTLDTVRDNPILIPPFYRAVTPRT